MRETLRRVDYNPDSMHRGEMGSKDGKLDQNYQVRASNARPDKEGRGRALSASLKEKTIPPQVMTLAPLLLCPPPAAQSVCPFLLVHQSLMARKGSGDDPFQR